jgi:dipeptidyl-peptidase-4
MGQNGRWAVLAVLGASALASSAVAGAQAAGMQASRVYAAADYAQAEEFMDYNLDPLAYHAVEAPVWLTDGRVWFRDAGPDGVTYVLADPAKGTKTAAFDQAKVAAALQVAIVAGRVRAPKAMQVDGGHLPVDDLRLENGDRSAVLLIAGRWVRCDLRGGGGCADVNDALAADGEAYDFSPDGTKAVFIRADNLWVRDVATGRETQLTTDGAPDYGYATDNSGWIHSGNPLLVWSPDSRKIATFQQDQRKVGRMYLVGTSVGHPELESWAYPLPGDANVTMIERVVIDIAARKVVRLKMPPEQHRSSLCDDLSCAGGRGWDDVQWSEDGRWVGFVSTSRDHKQEWMRVADAATGAVREVMGESAATYFESGNELPAGRSSPGLVFSFATAGVTTMVKCSWNGVGLANAIAVCIAVGFSPGSPLGETEICRRCGRRASAVVAVALAAPSGVTGPRTGAFALAK